MARPLVTSFARVPLVAAAFVVGLGSAAAADSTDNLEQMRAVLSGRIATHAAPASALKPAVKQVGDAQRSAQELILGTTNSDARAAVPATTSEATRPKAVPAARVLAHDDAQAMARRLLLGQTSADSGS